MANYGDDFFVEGNIIGYTGTLGQQETVYFRSGDTFGRITQAHDDQDNVGRSKVRTYADYSIRNSIAKGVAEESYNGSVRHTSRHPFIAVTPENIDQLAQAINNFRDLKPKYR